jgi:hypothetical protein
MICSVICAYKYAYILRSVPPSVKHADMLSCMRINFLIINLCICEYMLSTYCICSHTGPKGRRGWITSYVRGGGGHQWTGSREGCIGSAPSDKGRGGVHHGMTIKY